MALPTVFSLEVRAEIARANAELGAGAVYVAPDTVGAYDPSTGGTGSTPGLTYPVLCTPGGKGTAQQDGSTIQIDDELVVITGLPPEVTPQEGGRLTTETEDYAVVGVQRHAILGYPVSFTLRLRDA